jgi:hypothetical protein
MGTRGRDGVGSEVVFGKAPAVEAVDVVAVVAVAVAVAVAMVAEAAASCAAVAMMVMLRNPRTKRETRNITHALCVTLTEQDGNDKQTVEPGDGPELR